TEAVDLPGEFSRRGGILDVFSVDAEAPYRLEFFGDEIESIRQFAPHTQRSLQELQAVDITGTASEGAHAQGNGKDIAALPYTGHFCDYLPEGTWTVLVETADLTEQAKHYLERVADPRGLFSVQGVLAQLLRFPNVRLSALPAPTVEATCHLRVES